MASFFGINDSFFGTNTSYSTNNNMLGDYAMIKNGAYKKLLNAYYTKKSNGSTEETEETDEKKSEKTKLLQSKSRADALKKAADDLNNSKLFEGTEDEETGKIKYDTEKITKKLTSFVNAYNDLVDASSDVDNQKVLRQTLWMVNNTRTNSRLLDKVGITIGKDNKLSIDEEKVKNADIGALKVLFTGYGSLSDKVSIKAKEIGNFSDRGINVISDLEKTYTKNGDYSKTSASTFYDELF